MCLFIINIYPQINNYQIDSYADICTGQEAHLAAKNHAWQRTWRAQGIFLTDNFLVLTPKYIGQA